MSPRAFFSRQAVVALILCPILLFQLNQIRFFKPTSFKEEYQISPAFLKFVSAGFWPAAADALWIQTIQLIGGAKYSTEAVESTLSFYRLGTDLDPDFREFYEQGGVMFLFFFENPEAASEILMKGISRYESGQAPQKRWKNPVSLYIFLAYVYAFQKNDWKSAKAIYLKAADLENAPPYLKKMKTWLEKENSEQVLARRVLQMLIGEATDPVIKQKYEEKLRHYE